MEMERPPFAPLTKSTQRLLHTGLILCGWALLILVRLFDLQVFAHDQYVKLGESQQEKLEPIDAPRGAILDRHGNYLAISSPSQFVVVNPQRIPNKEIAGALLARILGFRRDEVAEGSGSGRGIKAPPRIFRCRSARLERESRDAAGHETRLAGNSGRQPAQLSERPIGGARDRQCGGGRQGCRRGGTETGQGAGGKARADARQD